MQKTITSIGEFGLIEMIRDRFATPEGILGIGDDCAVIPQGAEDLLVSTDLLVEDVHFLRSDADPWQIGWKSAAVNISDIAAMGGCPIATFLSIALPQDLESQWVENFIEGYREISERYNVPLLGGDTTSSKGPVAINVVVLGTIQKGKSKLRSAATSGDLVCVTGTLGDSGAGLNLVLEGSSDGKGNIPDNAYQTACKYLRDRHYRPVPRVKEGMIFSSSEAVHAMMDISDGVASDLKHILKASGVAAEIDVDTLPLSVQMQEVCKKNGWDPIRLALTSGEDYELLFTCQSSEFEKLACKIKAYCGTPVHAIGRIIQGAPQLTFCRNSQPVGLTLQGFTHF